MVPPARFQRATFRLGGGRSMQLSYGSTMLVNGKWEMVNGKAASALTAGVLNHKALFKSPR
jgi:hypothetical protein